MDKNLTWIDIENLREKYKGIKDYIEVLNLKIETLEIRVEYLENNVEYSDPE